MMSVNMIEQATIAASVRCLENYEIDTVAVVRPRAFADVIEEPSKAAVVGEGILSFTGDLSEQNREDALHSFLFASLVANKDFPRESQGKEWYLKFVEVMQSNGWLSSQKFYSDLNLGSTSFKIDEVVLQILASLVAGLAVPGPAAALMLKVAGDAMTVLKKKEKALTLFERNMLGNGVGGMAVGTCTEIKGEVTMALGTVRFIRKNTGTEVLGTDWSSREVKLYKGETVFRKVPYIADATREIVRAKLGINAVSKIESYEI